MVVGFGAVAYRRRNCSLGFEVLVCYLEKWVLRTDVLMRTSNSKCGRVCKTLWLENIFGAEVARLVGAGGFTG